MNKTLYLKHIHGTQWQWSFPPVESRILPPSSRDVHVLVPEPVSMLGFKANKVTVWTKDASQLTLKSWVYPELPGWNQYNHNGREKSKVKERHVVIKSSIMEMLCCWLWRRKRRPLATNRGSWTWQGNEFFLRVFIKEHSPVIPCFYPNETCSKLLTYPTIR